MRKLMLFSMLLAGLTACNSVYVKPNTLDTDATFYAYRGGYTMRRAIKQEMENRNYKVIVGKAKSIDNAEDGVVGVDLDRNTIPRNTKYVVKVSEYDESFYPIWCMFNGFWWWHFNVSIADQESGQEILAWRGRGCANSSVRMLNRILDEMEIK